MYKKFMPYFNGDGGAGGGNPAGDPGSNLNGSGDSGTGNDDGNNGSKSFDEILKENPSFQSELDRRINKAVETATGNERDRLKIIQDDLQDEVLRVSKMTEAEKETYFKQKSEREAAKREADLTRRELMLDARTALQEKGLPDEFVDLLVYTDKDACNKSIDILNKAFSEAVQKAVDEKLKGTTPPDDAGTQGQGSGAHSSDYEKAKAEAIAAMGLRTK